MKFFNFLSIGEMMGKKIVVELSEILRPFTCIFWFLFLCFCGGCVCACVCMFLDFRLLALFLCVCWEREREVLGEWGSEDDLGGVVWGEKCDQNRYYEKIFLNRKRKKKPGLWPATQYFSFIYEGYVSKSPWMSKAELYKHSTLCTLFLLLIHVYDKV